MKLTVKQSGVPIGNYRAKFVGVSEGQNDKGSFLRWEWEIVQGEHKGQKASRITSTAPTLKNACGKIVSGLIGKTLTQDIEFDSAAYVGKEYVVVVTAANDGGATKVEAVVPA